MKYEVVITARAQREAQSNYDWWAAKRSAEQAMKWFDELLKVAASLSDHPDRCALAAENDLFPYEIRQLNFGIGSKPTQVYAVRPSDVVVLRVRHLAQQPIEL
jgi:plasmid stabilization system protein ParE